MLKRKMSKPVFGDGMKLQLKITMAKEMSQGPRFINWFGFITKRENRVFLITSHECLLGSTALAYIL